MKKMITLFLAAMISVPALLASNPIIDGNNNVPEKKHEGKVIHLTTAEFKTLIWDYDKNPDEWIYEGDIPCMIDFYADWCKPCKMIAPIMEELAAEYKGEIYIYKVNTDNEKEVARIFNIRSIPAILLVPMDGKPQMATGALPKTTFVEIIDKTLLGKE